MSHVPHMNESWTCHTYECVVLHECCMHAWVKSNATTSHVTDMNVSCHTDECVMSHIWMCHAAHMLHAYMNHVKRTKISRHTYEYSCRTYEWDMSPYEFAMHVAHVLHACMSHVERQHMSHRTLMCGLYNPHLWRGHVTRMSESFHRHEWIMSRMSSSHFTRMDKTWNV